MCNCQGVKPACCAQPCVQACAQPVACPFLVKRVKQLNFQISETELFRYLNALKCEHVRVIAMSVSNPVSVGLIDTAIVRIVTDDYKKALSILRSYNTIVLTGFKVLKIDFNDFALVAEKWGIIGPDDRLHLSAAYTARDGSLIVQPNNAEQIL